MDNFYDGWKNSNDNPGKPGFASVASSDIAALAFDRCGAEFFSQVSRCRLPAAGFFHESPSSDLWTYRYYMS